MQQAKIVTWTVVTGMIVPYSQRLRNNSAILLRTLSRNGCITRLSNHTCPQYDTCRFPIDDGMGDPRIVSMPQLELVAI